MLQAIEGLSSKDKEATLLFYYEQLTLQEIAALLDVSVGTIKSRLYRARKQLQKELATGYLSEHRKEQLMKRPIYISDTLMEHFEQALPFERIGLHTEFREVNRDVVLNEHKAQKEDFLQFFASLNRSILELELQRDKEKREKTKQESIASWKEKHRQNQQET